MQRIGRERGGVVAVELGERAHEVGGGSVARGERVGLEFLAPGDEACERLEREGEYRNYEGEAHEHRTDARVGEVQRLVEGRLAVEPSKDREQPGGEREEHREQARDVAAREMAELMGEDRLDLLGREALEQRVEEHDALVGSESGEVGVAVARAANRP